MQSQFDKLLEEKQNYKPLEYYKQAHRIGKNIWYVERLVKLTKSMPVRTIPITDVRAIKLGLPLIKHDCTHMDLAYHMRVSMHANLEYPVILGDDGRIMDGHHRVIKTLAEGYPTIKVVQFVIDPEPDKVMTDDEVAQKEAGIEDLNIWIYNEGCEEGV